MVFKIKNLKVNAFDKEILKGVNLEILPGQIHAIMGPNGAGKSTLASAIMGDPKFKVTGGEIFLNNKNVLEMEIDERAKEGIFLAMQYPVEVPGITNFNFIKTAVNATRKERIGVVDFSKELDKNIAVLEMKKDISYRYLNDGFSGGEKKRNEILQMLMLKPCLAVLDEIDSGLDLDALKVVGNAINQALKKDTAVLIITHYQRILEYVKPDFVHIMIDGKIVKTGEINLVEKIEKFGYDSVLNNEKAGNKDER